jgi:hypothetical protein
MAAAVTLPLLGTITIPLKVAPFQIPNSVPGTTPYMSNGTGGSVGGSSIFGGYFGLRYLYNQQMSTVPNSSFGMGSVYQLSGGTINSFGVFDYYTGEFPTVKTALYAGGVNNSVASINIIETFSGYRFYATSISSAILPAVILVNDVSMPSILFENIVTKGGISTNNFSYHNSGALGNVEPCISPVYFDLINGWTVIDPGTVNVNTSPTTASGAVFALSGTTGAVIPPYRANVIQNGVLTQAGVVITNGISSLTSAASWSPNTGNYLVRVVGGQLAYVKAWTTTPLHSDGNTQFADNRVNITLANSADNALMDTGPNFDSSAPYCTIPTGDFLCAPNKPTVPGTSTTLFLIKADMTGYYRVIMSNAPAWQYFSSGGFGVDLNGNFWIFGPGHVLYSNLDLGFPLFLGAFPNLSSNSVGCRRNGCNYSWFG